MDTIELDLNGITALPAGKIANVATCLQMFAPPDGHVAPAAPAGCRLDPLMTGDGGRYTALFRAVGEPWLWFSRIDWSAAKAARHIEREDIEAFALTVDGIDAGLLELDFATDGDVELAFFGLVPDAIGAGSGRYLMSEAIQRAFARGPMRFWVHTCTFDHPAALGFYRASGFVPYQRMIEVADDPRLDGRCRRDAAPHVPVL